MFFNFKVSKSFLAVIFLFLFSVFSCIAYSSAAPTATKADTSSVKSLSLPVIMYHSLLKDENLQGDYVISPELFQSDIKYLKENGYRIIGAQELLDYSEGKLDLPDKCVMLTFDDGYYNNYLYAYQIAKEENVKFVLSPIGINSEIQTEGEHLSPSYSHCTWAQLKEMVSSGCVELMNHSYDMHKNTSRKGTKIMSGESANTYKTALTADLTKAQSLFKNEVGVTPTGFTYPFGAVCDEAEQIIREMGFRLSFTCEEKTNTIEAGNPDSLYGIGRYLRNNKESSKAYFERILKE
ncbi:MAG: polysaccharide deacetylase family protein [Acutalibacteraceae bacterium]